MAAHYPVTTYLLSERENPNSRVRENGVRFWGHPVRRGGLSSIRAVAIHTAETDPTTTSARAVARWQAFTASSPSSYHVLVDSATIVRTLRDASTAFHVARWNTPSLGLSFATRARLWGQNPSWDREALDRGAWVAAQWAGDYGIPVRWITKAQADRGSWGFVRHSTMDPGRRSDPGALFPEVEFFRRVNEHLNAEQTIPPELLEEAEVKKLVHISKRGGAAYELIDHPFLPGKYALKRVPNRGAAEAITGNEEWDRETVIMKKAEADELEKFS